MAKPLAVVKSLDHLVLTCANIPATITFYQKYLGMHAVTFGPPHQHQQPRHALTFGAQKINLHARGHEFEPKAQTALPGTADLCFVVESPPAGRTLEDLVCAFRDDGVNVLAFEEEGEGGGAAQEVVARTGARGPMRSIYVRDPDGNLVESVVSLSAYSMALHCVAVRLLIPLSRLSQYDA